MVLDFNTLYTFPGRFDRLLEEFLSPSYADQRRLAYPPLNLSEDKDNLYARFEMPGIDIDDVELTITDKSLVVKGERVNEKGKYYRQERPAGVFQRIVSINSPIAREEIKAVMKDGILTVTLPKSEEVKPKKINIAIT